MVNQNAVLQLRITVRRSVTVLPRCLQILSRRGFILATLETRTQPDGTFILNCAVEGPQRWHETIIPLLARLTDVLQVESAYKTGDEHD